MLRKIGATTVALALVLLGFGAGSHMTRVARADVSGSPNTSCGTSTACLTESNTAGGPGVKSSSSHGTGLVSTTKATGSISSNGGSALLGQDLQTTSGKGLFNFGVNGTSMFGTGVQGSGAVGVSGVSTGAAGIGVLATMPTLGGLLFKGTGYTGGVFTIDSTGDAIFGDPRPGFGSGQVAVSQYCGNGNPMFRGSDQLGSPFQVTDCGDVFTTGYIEAGTEVQTNKIAPFGGVNVEVSAPVALDDGVTSSFQSFGGTNFIASDAVNLTWLYQGYSATAGKYTVEMGDSGSVYARVFITTGESRVAQQTAAGRRIDTYAPQVSQPSIEDFGEAQLVDGMAEVALDPNFASAIDAGTRYYVMLTPEGDCRGLYVAQRTSAGFIVRELQSGRSSIPFTYRIVAKPFGDDSARLPSSSLPYGFDHKIPPPRIPHGQHARGHGSQLVKPLR